WDVAVERRLEITDRDAARFAQLTPRDLSSTQPEQCKHVLICAPDGGESKRPAWSGLERPERSVRKADSSPFGTSYAARWGGGQMAVVRRGAWWILIALVVGTLMGGAVMMYAATRALNATR
ncbi:MAG: hypothetical protein M3O29_00670, partial [Actinomycetota bacterium]|nr:hypothetical protein [Actinomycetota bacterium]